MKKLIIILALISGANADMLNKTLAKAELLKTKRMKDGFELVIKSIVKKSLGYAIYNTADPDDLLEMGPKDARMVALKYYNDIDKYVDDIVHSDKVLPYEKVLEYMIYRRRVGETKKALFIDTKIYTYLSTLGIITIEYYIFSNAKSTEVGMKDAGYLEAFRRSAWRYNEVKHGGDVSNMDMPPLSEIIKIRKRNIKKCNPEKNTAYVNRATGGQFIDTSKFCISINEIVSIIDKEMDK